MPAWEPAVSTPSARRRGCCYPSSPDANAIMDRMDQATYDKGRQIRAAVLGEDYVANAERQADDFSKPLQDLLTEYCWGAVWGREELPLKTRSMLNLAMISVLN